MCEKILGITRMMISKGFAVVPTFGMLQGRASPGGAWSRG